MRISRQCVIAGSISSVEYGILWFSERTRQPNNEIKSKDDYKQVNKIVHMSAQLLEIVNNLPQEKTPNKTKCAKDDNRTMSQGS